MGIKIKNVDLDLTPSLDDFTLGTEKATGDSKSYSFRNQFSLLDEILEKSELVFEYADSNNAQNHLNTGFVTSDNDSFATLTEIKINKDSYNEIDVTTTMVALAAVLVSEPITLDLKNTNDGSNFAAFNISAITNNATHFVITMAVKGGYLSGSFVDGNIYFLTPKSSIVTGIPSGTNPKLTVASITALKALINISISKVIQTESYYGDNKGGGNIYVKVTDTGQVDDGGSVIKGTDGSVYETLYNEDVIYVEQFGINVGNNTSQMFQNVLDAAENRIVKSSHDTRIDIQAVLGTFADGVKYGTLVTKDVEIDGLRFNNTILSGLEPILYLDTNNFTIRNCDVETGRATLTRSNINKLMTEVNIINNRTFASNIHILSTIKHSLLMRGNVINYSVKDGDLTTTAQLGFTNGSTDTNTFNWENRILIEDNVIFGGNPTSNGLLFVARLPDYSVIRNNKIYNLSSPITYPYGGFDLDGVATGCVVEDNYAFRANFEYKTETTKPIGYGKLVTFSSNTVEGQSSVFKGGCVVNDHKIINPDLSNIGALYIATQLHTDMSDNKNESVFINNLTIECGNETFSSNSSSLVFLTGSNISFDGMSIIYDEDTEGNLSLGTMQTVVLNAGNTVITTNFALTQKEVGLLNSDVRSIKEDGTYRTSGSIVGGYTVGSSIINLSGDQTANFIVGDDISMDLSKQQIFTDQATISNITVNNLYSNLKVGSLIRTGFDIENLKVTNIKLEQTSNIYNATAEVKDSLFENINIKVLSGFYTTYVFNNSDVFKNCIFKDINIDNSIGRVINHFIYEQGLLANGNNNLITNCNDTTSFTDSWIRSDNDNRFLVEKANNNGEPTKKVNISGKVNSEFIYLRSLTKTGVSLDLSNIKGNLYNWAAASNATTYTTIYPVENGYARCLINALSEPTVTGATKRVGAAFIVSTNMEMVVESPDGTIVYFYFIEI